MQRSGHVAERFTRTTQNRVGLSHVGSNPTMPTRIEPISKTNDVARSTRVVA